MYKVTSHYPETEMDLERIGTTNCAKWSTVLSVIRNNLAIGADVITVEPTSNLVVQVRQAGFLQPTYTKAFADPVTAKDYGNRTIQQIITEAQEMPYYRSEDGAVWYEIIDRRDNDRVRYCSNGYMG